MNRASFENIIKLKQEKAFSTLLEARDHIEKSYLSTAMNRIYYAGLYEISNC